MLLPRPRVAWFTPLPPVRSGVSAYSLDLLPSLAASHAIEVFIDGPSRKTGSVEALGDAGISTHSAHDFLWRRRASPYDIVIYQMGNAPCHDYMWPYLTRFPGLVILHDGQLHHARARQLLVQQRTDDYRAEFVYAHPDARPEIAGFAIARFGGVSYYFWPFLRLVLDASRRVAVHNHWLADSLRAQSPGLTIDTIRMGVPAVIAEPAPHRHHRRQVIRGRLGLPEESVVFAAFGGITPEKRIPQVLRAFPAVRRAAPTARLLLVGNQVPHYDVARDARDCGVSDHVIITGYVDDEALADHLLAADVCLCMRWPSTRETSASWLRCLTAGRPTIVTDLVHTAEVPTLDPRTWTVLQAATDGSHASGTTDDPVAISLDILDEDHSLRLAMRRLAIDAPLRADLGRQAACHWKAHHTVEQMASDYGALIASAIRESRPPADPDTLPAHLFRDGSERARLLLAEMGVSLDLLEPRERDRTESP